MDPEWHGLLDSAINEFAAARVTRVRLGAGDTTALAVLDGGVVFHTNEGRSGRRLPDGVYVIGRQCARLVVDICGGISDDREGSAQSDVALLRSQARAKAVVMGDAESQAALLADRVVVRDWNAVRDALKSAGSG